VRLIRHALPLLALALPVGALVIAVILSAFLGLLVTTVGLTAPEQIGLARTLF
jgi:hypothetical protein